MVRPAPAAIAFDAATDVLQTLGRHFAAAEPAVFALAPVLLGSASTTDEHVDALLRHCIAQPLPPPAVAFVPGACAHP